MNLIYICRMTKFDQKLCGYLFEQGFRVFYTYTAENKEAAGRLEAEAGGQGGLLDPGDKDTALRVIRAFAGQKKPLDCLITSLGLCHPGGVGEVTTERMREMISCNVNLLYYTLKEALPMMMEGKTLYCNIMDSSAYHAVGGLTAFSMTQAAGIGFMKSMTKEYARYGIRTANFVTDVISRDILTGGMSDREAVACQKTRLGTRFLTQDEMCEQIAEIIRSLKHITGQTIFVDDMMTDYMFC